MISTTCVLLISISLDPKAIQCAKLSGFNPIITTASLHNEPLLLSLGATRVVERSSETNAERTPAAVVAEITSHLKGVVP